jgi:hypothetical protein
VTTPTLTLLERQFASIFRDQAATREKEAGYGVSDRERGAEEYTPEARMKLRIAEALRGIADDIEKPA